MDPNPVFQSLNAHPISIDQNPIVRVEKIEILSVELLQLEQAVITELKELAKSLHIEFGWHYLLDLSWTIQSLGSPMGLQILDAGAGVGILQWYLAQAGADVTSVDRMSRALLPLRYRNRFAVKGFHPSDLLPAWQVLLNYITQPLDKHGFRQVASRILALWRDLISCLSKTKCKGSVTIYHQDLSNLVDIPDQSFDAIVSISALEHNSPQDLIPIIHELMRVIKPGGSLIATLVAARDHDWFHDASSGWCYTESSLRDLFELPPEVHSNYNLYDELFAKLRDCSELRENLARFYSQSNSKGMPGGIWNPEYQPVGVIKIKKSAGS